MITSSRWHWAISGCSNFYMQCLERAVAALPRAGRPEHQGLEHEPFPRAPAEPARARKVSSEDEGSFPRSRAREVFP